MKIMLLKDVYNLGRAGEVKKVANGYGRNYLIPQGLAVLATSGALKQADRIRAKADVQRAVLNQEMGGVAEQIQGLQFVYPAKAGETGKLYGSISTQMLANDINTKVDTDIHRRQIDSQPLRMLGVHKVNVLLTIDLAAEITVVIHREGESVEAVIAAYEEALLAGEEALDALTEELIAAEPSLEEDSLDAVDAVEPEAEAEEPQPEADPEEDTEAEEMTAAEAASEEASAETPVEVEPEPEEEPQPEADPEPETEAEED